MKDKILITGGLGYVGARLAQALAGDSSYDLWLGTRRMDAAAHLDLPAAHVVRLDILSGDDLSSACRGARSIVHLAALDEAQCRADPERALHVNVLGTLKLLRHAEAAGVERLVYLSTAHVYGSPLAGRISEHTVPRPVHPYATSHRAAEDLVLAAHAQQKLCGVVLRAANGFGAPAHPFITQWMLIGNDLCRQAATHGELVLRSAGLQRRDFIPLTDLIRTIRFFLEAPVPICGDGLFNIGSENPMTIIAFAELVASRCQAVLGFRPVIRHPEPRSGEVSLPLVYCVEKLKATGFRPGGNFHQEIDDTLQFCHRFFAKETTVACQA